MIRFYLEGTFQQGKNAKIYLCGATFAPRFFIFNIERRIKKDKGRKHKEKFIVPCNNKKIPIKRS